MFLSDKDSLVEIKGFLRHIRSANVWYQVAQDLEIFNMNYVHYFDAYISGNEEANEANQKISEIKLVESTPFSAHKNELQVLTIM